jgi:hypothetical protein
MYITHAEDAEVRRAEPSADLGERIEEIRLFSQLCSAKHERDCSIAQDAVQCFATSGVSVGGGGNMRML